MKRKANFFPPKDNKKDREEIKYPVKYRSLHTEEMVILSYKRFTKTEPEFWVKSHPQYHVTSRKTSIQNYDSHSFLFFIFYSFF